MTGPRPLTPGPARRLRLGVGLLVLVLAHFGLGPLLGGPPRVDFLAIAVLFAAVRVRPGVAALAGLGAGAVADAFAPGAFGAWMLAFTLVGAAASRLRAAFFAEHAALTAGFVLAGTWVASLVHDVAAGGARSAGTAHWLVWGPLSAVATALVAMALLVLLAPLYAARPR
jgi:rod shape-determining protein MreD